VYLTDTEPRPMSQLSLRRCIVKDEGLRTGPRNRKTQVRTLEVVLQVEVQVDVRVAKRKCVGRMSKFMR
jgi:hypothetical protein